MTDSARGIGVYVYVGDVDALCARFTRAGLRKVELEPTDQEWGQREVYVRDPDGNAIRFGAPIKR